MTRKRLTLGHVLSFSGVNVHVTPASSYPPSIFSNMMLEHIYRNNHQKQVREFLYKMQNSEK